MMSVRAAKFVDIPRIVEIMAEGHARSRFASCTPDVIEAKQLLVRCIQRHGHTNYLGSMVLVSERDGVVQGFVVAILDAVYPCLKELRVTDLFFIFGDKASPRDAMQMVKQLIAWGRDNPKCVETFLSVNDAIGDWRRIGKIYERAGLEKCGAMYRLEFSRIEQEAAA